MPGIDLTQFGFTPTESLVYEVLLRNGPGTGYAIARSARLARANAYSALEGLVAKGAARVEGGRPRQYAPESPTALVARITNRYGLALDQLSAELGTISNDRTPSVVEIDSARAVLQLITRDVTKAHDSVLLLVPPDAYPLLAPGLRRPVAAGLRVSLWSTAPVQLEFTGVGVVADDSRWPGMPIITVVDERSSIVAARSGGDVHGHWSSAPWFVAAARLAAERLGAHE
jgi:sugar-specific transcriptional regulator TrmB